MKPIKIPRIRLLVFGIAWILSTIVIEILHQIVIQIVVDSTDYSNIPYPPPLLRAIYDTTGYLGVSIRYLWLLRGLFYGIGVMIILYWCYLALRTSKAH